MVDGLHKTHSFHKDSARSKAYVLHQQQVDCRQNTEASLELRPWSMSFGRKDQQEINNEGQESAHAATSAATAAASIEVIMNPNHAEVLLSLALPSAGASPRDLELV